VLLTVPEVRAADEHEHHRAEVKPGYARSVNAYRLPELTLIRLPATSTRSFTYVCGVIPGAV
jgi:hypothetical protein